MLGGRVAVRLINECRGIKRVTYVAATKGMEAQRTIIVAG